MTAAPVMAEEAAVARELAGILMPLLENAALADDIWAGYKPSERGLGVYRPGAGILVRHCLEAPPSGWTPLDELAGSGSSVECGLFRADTAGLGEASFHIEHDFGPFRASLIRHDQRLAMLIHEDFHGFQRGWSDSPARSTLARLDEDGDSAALRASLERESALLADALTLDDAQESRALLARWLALRRARDASQSPRFVAVTSQNEIFEGSATWVGYRAELRLLGESNLGGRLEPFRRQLGPDPQSISNRMMFVYYFQGAALSALLDRLADDRRWQQRLSEGEAFPKLVDDLLGLDPGQLDQLLADERAGRAWRRTERAHGRALAQYQRAQRDRVAHAWVLEFHVPYGDVPVEDRPRATFSFVSDEVGETDQGLIIIENASRFEFNKSDTRITVRDQTILLSHHPRNEAQAYSVIAIPLRRPLRSDRLPADGSVVELTEFVDRSARIELHASVPVLARQVEMPR